MKGRREDGSAGDADYGAIGGTYVQYRQPEPQIAEFILRALGNARTVLNVGAGAGSYEPVDREVTPVEPSESMRKQRPSHLPQAIDAVAESLPFPDKHFDASMATFTVHQWANLSVGLAEMRRVTRGQVVILTCEPTELDVFWLNDYVPEVIAVEAGRYPPISEIVSSLGGAADVFSVPIPLNCADGFGEAYYGRPELLLEPGARLACSAWSFVNQSVEDRFVQELGRDLASGSWDTKYGHLRSQPEFLGSLKLVAFYTAAHTQRQY